MIHFFHGIFWASHFFNKRLLEDKILCGPRVGSFSLSASLSGESQTAVPAATMRRQVANLGWGTLVCWRQMSHALQSSAQSRCCDCRLTLYCPLAWSVGWHLPDAMDQELANARSWATWPVRIMQQEKSPWLHWKLQDPNEKRYLSKRSAVRSSGCETFSFQISGSSSSSH